MFSKTHLLNAAGTHAYSVEPLKPIGVILLRRLADYQDKTRQVPQFSVGGNDIEFVDATSRACYYYSAR